MTSRRQREACLYVEMALLAAPRLAATAPTQPSHVRQAALISLAEPSRLGVRSPERRRSDEMASPKWAVPPFHEQAGQ